MTTSFFRAGALALAIVASAVLPAQEPPKPREQEPPKPAPHAEPKAEPDRLVVETSFEDVGDGGLPKGWTVTETGGASKPATWRVEADEKAPDGKKLLRIAANENRGQTYNLLMSAAIFPADVTVEVKIRADDGVEDQGGGVFWRAADANNYYIARWNPLEKNLRAYKVEGGKRTMLKGTDLDADAKAWHEIKVTMTGTKGSVAFDDKTVLEFDDPSFAHDGKVGLWTKADAASSFDELEISWKKPKGEPPK